MNIISYNDISPNRPISIHTHTHRNTYTCTHTHTRSCARVLKTQTRQAPLNNPLNLQLQQPPHPAFEMWMGRFIGLVSGRCKPSIKVSKLSALSLLYPFVICTPSVHIYKHRVRLSGLYTTPSSHTKKKRKEI